MSPGNSEIRAGKAAIRHFRGGSVFPGTSENGHRRTGNLVLDGLSLPSRSLEPR